MCVCVYQYEKSKSDDIICYVTLGVHFLNKTVGYYKFLICLTGSTLLLHIPVYWID